MNTHMIVPKGFVKICKVEECEEPVYFAKLCNKHYQKEIRKTHGFIIREDGRLIKNYRMVI